MVLVKVDNKGRVLLSKELRKQSGVESNDRLIAKALSDGKILLEKPARQATKEDPLDWLLGHPAKIRSAKLAKEVSKIGSTRGLLEKWKDDLWMGE